MNDVLGVDHVALTVGDVEASAQFYERLGFSFERRLSFAGPDAARLTGVPDASLQMIFLRFGEFRLELIEYAPRGRQDARANNDRGAAHVCLRVNDIEGVYARLTAEGATFTAPPHHHPSGVSMAYLADPDGICLELLETRAAVTPDEISALPGAP